MTILPLHRVQCDRCRTVLVLAAQKTELWGDEMHSFGWVARPVHGRYQHACRACADEFLGELNQWKRRG
jgi:hypothetical protein